MFGLIFPLFFGCALVQALTGFDMSLQDCDQGGLTQSTFNCFVSNGFGFAVLQAAQGGNGETRNIANCVSYAARSGMAVSLYGWFCPVCHGQADPVATGKQVILDLQSKGIYPGKNYTYFYVDVEDCDPDDNCWLDSKTNQNYVLGLVKGLQSAGASVGIYASPYEWNKLMGSSAWANPALYSLPLWYANWNGKDDMSGFSPFGGWTQGHMHQWADSCPVCFNVDRNFIEG